ncbi:MAG: hypothetical protein AB7I04_00325 [Pseudomonadales bacterium]
MRWEPVTGIEPCALTRREVARRFRELARGGEGLKPAGRARRAPEQLLASPFVPKHRVMLFDATYFLTDFYHVEDLNFFVGYVLFGEERADAALYPRIFYKDSSLVWRVASHLIDSAEEQWIGKGEIRVHRTSEGTWISSDESSTNLPYEIQTAFDDISRRRPSRRNAAALALVLRDAPAGRFEPYADFRRPRREAAARYPVNAGRPIARITRPEDPRSLQFARGFEPDFDHGLLEIGASRSTLYGGEIRKHRIASANRVVQYQFVSSPTHVFVNPPQTFMPKITTYGVRALHVLADDEIFLPGYEYHFVDDSVDPPELFTQIPPGWAGPASSIDPFRADASPWIEALPVIAEFRRRMGIPRPTAPRAT